jgi:hypothetical protein
MKLSIFSLLAVVSIIGWGWTRAAKPAPAADARTPLLVELFTSEGCSSCPPADRFLEKLDQQPIAGAEVIVLSEHVDYWNHIGWKDPFSARSYSDRQSTYASRFALASVYTPQMVVDGTAEFVGSNSGLAEKSFAKALRSPKIPLRLSSISVDTSNTLHVHLETGILEPSFGLSKAEVYLAVALKRAQSQVSAGENGGHKLVHVSVVRSLTRLGTVEQGHNFAEDTQIKLEPGSDGRNLRLIAFLQAPAQGRVLGAASLPVVRN